MGPAGQLVENDGVLWKLGVGVGCGHRMIDKHSAYHHHWRLPLGGSSDALLGGGDSDLLGF